VVGMELEGVGGTGASGWTDLLQDGARPGPLRRGAREVAFTVHLFAADRAGLPYGLGWLASALRGDLCADGCEADELVMMAAPPEPPASAEADCAGSPADARAVALADDPEGRGNELERHLYRCRLLEGPTVESWTRITGAVQAEVTFTIKAGIPYWYYRPVDVWNLKDTRPEDYWTAVVTNWDSQQVYDNCADQAENTACLIPPEDDRYPCPPINTPLYPNPPKDPCYAGDHYPIGWRTLYRIPEGLTTAWLEKAPVFRIDNGLRQIRSLMLRWYTNPLNRPPRPENLDSCSVCAELWLPYLPPYSHLVIDGRMEQATVTCNNGAVDVPTLYGAGGGVYTWPTLECSSSMILEMVIDGRYGEPDGLDLQFQLADRQDAA